MSIAVHLSDQFYVLQTLKYKLAKYLVPILEHFAAKIVEQDSSNFMESLDIDSLFTNIPLEETIEICTNNLFKNIDIVHGLKKK